MQAKSLRGKGKDIVERARLALQDSVDPGAEHFVKHVDFGIGDGQHFRQEIDHDPLPRRLRWTAPRTDIAGWPWCARTRGCDR